MTRRVATVTLIATALTACAAERPNIILFMADDMGMGDTSAYQDVTGNTDDVQVHTPAMERLANAGVRFTDAHTPASRCTPTRYGLLTGRYPWRSRLKWYVLYGVQGDPLIEADRPTIASMLKAQGYATAMFGKWHVGLRYRRSDGTPAAGWGDADLTQPLHTGPLEAGFDVARFTSRSHATSGPNVAWPKTAKRNTPKQAIGPGHIHGRTFASATGNGKRLVPDGPNAYVLNKLGSRHSDHAIDFLQTHTGTAESAQRPFFLYYPANSNHGPYTPDESIGGKPVKGAARTKSGAPMDARHDFIYENDVALGRLMDWLAATDDPRVSGRKLSANTVVIFTSDNGAEKNSNTATGPFRSNKGSCYEGGHRVPFLISWPAGGVGNGDTATPGRTDRTPIGLHDLYATFAEITGSDLPDTRRGEKGAEDSVSIVPALRGRPMSKRPPLFFSDHKEAKRDPAVLAMRVDDPVVNGETVPGQWKVFFDARLMREGVATPTELYDLRTDQQERTNLIAKPGLEPLVACLNSEALLHRTCGGHRLADSAGTRRVSFDWQVPEGQKSPLDDTFSEQSGANVTVKDGTSGLAMTVRGVGKQGKPAPAFSPNFRGLGLEGGTLKQVDSGEALLVSFDRDVIVESAAVVAGNGVCGGCYRVGNGAPLAIYCTDADNDSKTQHGNISDIGVLKAGEQLRFDSAPHLGVETPGRWRLGAITVRPLQ